MGKKYIKPLGTEKRYIVSGVFKNGHPFSASVHEEDYNDFIADCENSTSDGSPLDVTSLVIQEALP